MEYTGYLGKLQACPGFEENEDCYYSPVPDKWSCNAGYFCLSPSHQEKCYPGFYCPEGTLQPLFCPPGYYCSHDAKEIYQCPTGFYCPLATVNPIKCWFSICPIGTSTPGNYFVLILLPCLFIIMANILLITTTTGSKQIRDYERLRKAEESTGEHLLITPDEQLATEQQSQQLEFKFQDIRFKYPGKSARPMILDGVSGSFKSSRLCAIVGGTGSGKTSLIHILAGRQQKSGGIIVIDNKYVGGRELNRIIGFVPQNDIMLPEMTVYETLEHECRMKQRASYRSQISNKVESVIHYLGLTKVTNDVVGNYERRGISGGELKRVNIGMELVSDPRILFMDEPTSGLDSTTATELCRLLKRLCKEKKMIIVTIVHSPPISALEEFDDILVMSPNGKIIYQGPTDEMEEYFSGYGFERSDKESLADFAMNISLGKYSDVNLDILESSWSTILQQSNTIIYTDTGMNYMERIHFYKPIDWAEQFWILLVRAWKQQYRRNISRFLWSQMAFVLSGMLISLAIQNFNYTSRQPSSICLITPLAMRSGCVKSTDLLPLAGMFICLGILYSGISAGFNTFGYEKVVFKREWFNGRTSVSAYFLAKVLADIPRIILAGVLFTISFALFFRYQANFSALMIVFILMYFTAFSMGYFISLCCYKELYGSIGTAFSLAWSLIFSGVFPYLENIHENYGYIEFLWTLSPTRWAIEAFWISEMKNRSFKLQEGLVALPYGYNWNGFQGSCLNMMAIFFMWTTFSYITLKLQHF